MKANLIPIRIGTLRPGAAVNFDIYIQVGDRHVHYIRTEDTFDPERIEKLRGKGVKKLFIPVSSEGAYLDYLDAGLAKLKDPKASIADRSEVASDELTTEAENALHNIETEQGYRRTEGRVQKMVDFLISETGAFRSVLATSGRSEDHFHHSANVTTLSMGLAQRLGLEKPRDLLDLGLAALLHDAALSQLGPAEYRKHPTRAAEMLAGKPYINKNILELVANHEEIGDGAGYPVQKRISTLPLASKILNLCNNYDRYSMSMNLLPLEAMKQYFTDRIGLFDLEHMKALSSLLK